MASLNTEQIREILPHRAPFLLIDEVCNYEPGAWAKAYKYVTHDEFYFPGHFPHKPVVPGVLIIEAIAQTGAVALLSEENNAGRIAYLGGIKHARFKAPVFPGDTLELICTLTKRRGTIGFGEGEARVGEKTVCRTEISFILPDE